MSRVVETAFIDVIVDDGSLLKVGDWIDAARNPAGRSPHAASRTLAESLSRIDARDADIVVRAAIDSALLGVFALFQSDFKNSGVHARIEFEHDVYDSLIDCGGLTEAYRMRVDPCGWVRPTAIETSAL